MTYYSLLVNVVNIVYYLHDFIYINQLLFILKRYHALWSSNINTMCMVWYIIFLARKFIHFYSIYIFPICSYLLSSYNFLKAKHLSIISQKSNFLKFNQFQEIFVVEHNLLEENIHHVSIIYKKTRNKTPIS